MCQCLTIVSAYDMVKNVTMQLITKNCHHVTNSYIHRYLVYCYITLIGTSVHLLIRAIIQSEYHVASAKLIK